MPDAAASSEPVACSLSGPQMATRQETMRRVFAGGLVDFERSGSTLRLCFQRRYEHDVRELARLEGECCPFLDIRVAARDPHAVLVLSAPADAGDTLEPFASAARAALAPA
jgi:hypothetical protein